jgi:uncharacterized membrane protein
MTKTIGWILLAILNAVLTIFFTIDIIDRIKMDMGFVGSAIAGGFFLIMTVIWIASAITEYNEYKNWLQDEQ